MSKEWSHWNYRAYCDENGEYGFIEAYYDTDGNIVAYSEFISPIAESISDLEFCLEKMAESLNKPTLFKGDLPK